MTNDAYRRTPEGYLVTQDQRLADVESRLGYVPPRLSRDGAEVTDWNQAIYPGFYYATNTAANGPVAGAELVGIVKVWPPTGRIVQEVGYNTITSALIPNTWRRVYNGSTWTVWVPIGVYNMGSSAIAATLAPNDFPNGISYAQGDSSFPAGLSVIHTIRYADTRCVQTCYEKGDSNNSRVWHRSSIDGSTWGPWVNDSGDSGWIAPSLLNGFTNGSNVAYRRLNGVTYLRGELLNATAPTSSTAAFTLPAGFRPSTRQRTVNWASTPAETALVFLTVLSSGNVEIVCPAIRSSTPGYNLACSFPADA